MPNRGNISFDQIRDLDTDDTLAADSDGKIPTQKAVKAYVDDAIAGVVGGGGAWGSITGTLSSQTDLNTALGTKVPTTRQVNGHALSADVTVSKSDVGLGSVTNDAQLKAADLDVDATMAANSDAKIASQKATKTALDAKLDDSQLDVDGTLAANSDSKVASQKAVKTYVDARGVIGTAIFSATGGTISNTYYSGCISSVTRVSTGKYTVNLSPNQQHFTVSITVSDDATAAMSAYLSGTPDLNSSLASFDFYAYAQWNVSAPRDAGMICVTITKL